MLRNCALWFWPCWVLPGVAAAGWDFTDQKLDNGLRVIVMEDHSSPVVAVQVCYHVGSKDDPRDRTGQANLLEHLMFRGTQNTDPGDHFKYLRRFGGKVVGYTTFDSTVFMQEVPSNQLDLTLWLEAERMAHLKLSRQQLEAEREAIKEEFRSSVSDRPYGTIAGHILRFAFQEHPYASYPMGDPRHIEAVTIADLEAFRRQYYLPNNAALVVVGDVTPSEVLEKARRYFGWIRPGPEPPRVTVQEPPVTRPRRLEVPEDKGPLALVGVGHRVMPAHHPDRHALAILNFALSGGESGRIYKRVVSELELAVTAGSGTFLLEQDGLWAAGAIVKMGVEPEAVETVLNEVIDGVLAEGITDRELLKARNHVAAKDVLQQMTVSGKADKLGCVVGVLDAPAQVATEFDDLMSVTHQDVLRVARRYLDPQSRMTLVVKPTAVARQDGQDADGAGGGHKTAVAGAAR